MRDSFTDKLREIVSNEEWKKVIEILSSNLDHSVSVIDLGGNELCSSGKLPHFIEILQSLRYGAKVINEQRVESLKKIFHSSNNIILGHSNYGMSHIWAPIILNEKLVGAVGCENILCKSLETIDFSDVINNTNLDKDEIKESIGRMNTIDEINVQRIKQILQLFASMIPSVIMNNYQQKLKIDELNSFYNLTKFINSTVNLDEIMVRSMKYLVDRLDAENASVSVLDKKKVVRSYYFIRDESLKKIENAIIPEIISARNKIFIKDVPNYYSIKNFNINPNYKSLVCYPLLIADKISGILTLYSPNVSVVDKEINDIIDFLTQQLAMAISNLQAYQHAKQDSHVDNLTGLYNRRFFIEVLASKLIPRISKEKPLSLAMIDIDDFKNYNDTFGHVKGDDLLKEIAQILKDEVRRTDVVGRYGGEEFIILFPEMSNANAYGVLERIRNKIRETKFRGGSKQPLGRVTISLGLVTCHDNSIKHDMLIDYADKALYKSKTKSKDITTSIVTVDKDLPNIQVDDI